MSENPFAQSPLSQAVAGLFSHDVARLFWQWCRGRHFARLLRDDLAGPVEACNDFKCRSGVVRVSRHQSGTAQFRLHRRADSPRAVPFIFNCKTYSQANPPEVVPFKAVSMIFWTRPYAYSQEWQIDQLLQFCRCNFIFLIFALFFKAKYWTKICPS